MASNVNTTRGASAKSSPAIDVSSMANDIRGFRTDLNDIKKQLNSITAIVSKFEALEKRLEEKDREVLLLNAKINEMQDAMDSTTKSNPK